MIRVIIALISVLSSTSAFASAQYNEELGQHCASFEKTAFNKCLENETAKFDEGNNPTDFLVAASPQAKQDMIKLLSSKKFAKNLKLKQQVQESLAIVLIAQYFDEIQLIYYTVSPAGDLKPVLILNMADVTYDYPKSFEHDKAIFYLHSKNASESIHEWLEDTYWD